MTVKELIAELQKMPPDAVVVLCVDPEYSIRDLYSVENRRGHEVHLNDKYYTPYAEEDLK